MVCELLLILVVAHISLTWFLAIRRGLAARRPDAETRGDDLSQPPVSILVPAWNERGTIEPCIQSLQRIEYPDWEVVILAGGLDGTFEVAVQTAAGDDRFRVLRRGPEPKNVALGQGIKAAQHDVLVLLDADSIVSPQWLRELIKPIVCGASVSLGERHPKQKTWITLAEQMQNIQTYDILGSSSVQGDRSLAIRRDVLTRLGTLPAHAYAREDWDLGIRLRIAGEPTIFAKGARLFVDRPATLGEFWQNEVRWRRTHLSGLWDHRTFFLKHPWMAFGQFYVYVLSICLSLVTIGGTLLATFWPAARPAVCGALGLTVLWIAGRRAALSAEVAAFTGDRVWLCRSWAPMLLVFVSFLASIVAILSNKRATPFDYKGPREAISA